MLQARDDTYNTHIPQQSTPYEYGLVALEIHTP